VRSEEDSRRPSISIIVPTLNEAQEIGKFLESLQSFRQRGVELILADGGSTDTTVQIASGLVDRAFVAAKRGRAAQMNAGAAQARGHVFLFLHADTRLPVDADRRILEGLTSRGHRWGRFDVRLSGSAYMLRWVERLMNLRSRMTGIATGDQAIFVERTLFDAVGGFPDISLMEDIAISRALKRHGWPLCLTDKVLTSSRRWERHGIWRTIFLMWRLRLAYFLGTSPDQLARLYHDR
jgi:rSAM/selenodomain-associated transferase 2